MEIKLSKKEIEEFLIAGVNELIGASGIKINSLRWNIEYSELKNASFSYVTPEPATSDDEVE